MTPCVSSFSPSLQSRKASIFGQGLVSTKIENGWRLCAERDECGNNVNDSEMSEQGPWKLPNDFNLLLNQCTIQSLIFLINSLKDRHTAIWLEDFTQPVIQSRTKDKKGDVVLTNMAKALSDAMHETQMERPIKLLTYHGLAALNTTLFPTWESYFIKLLQEPGVTYSIESSRPYVPNYELEINPASLCSRLISVREQLAREFVNDLDVISEISGQMLPNYFEKVKQGDEQAGIGRPNLMFLDMSVHEDYAPSSLRKGNFDLLVLLATQESIHRVLNDAANRADGSPDKSSVQFLRNFYTQRLGSHFTGSNWYSRADDFLDELLKSPASVVQLQDEECGLVDPVRVVELILKEREELALEWLEIALDAPKSHTEIKRWQLNRLMGIDTTVENSFE